MENLTKDRAKLKGHFNLECFGWKDESGKRFRDLRGRYERRLLWREEMDNIIPDQMLNSILNVIFDAATQITTWYCALVETNTTPAAGMTYAVPTYTECVAYTEGTRPEYVEAASTAKSTTNSANKAVFTINASKTIYGASLVGGGSAASTKGDTAGGGTLGAFALLGTAQPVISGNVINLTYTVTDAST